MNNDGTFNYSNLNNNLPEGFEEVNGIYIKDNNKFIVNSQGIVDTLLPYGYKECEYLESSDNGWYGVGNQYINTNYIPNDNTSIEFEYYFPDYINMILHNTDYSIFGSESMNLGFYRFSGVFSAKFKKGNNDCSIGIPSIYGETLKISISENTMELTNSKGTYTGTVDVDFTDASSLPMFLWAKNTEEGSTKKLAGRIYYFTILENSKIVANLIPALDQNDRPCMFDVISRKTFYNQGSGEFLYKLK